MVIRQWFSKRWNRGSLWNGLRLYLTLIAGALIAAFGYSLFQVPFSIAAGGVSGIAIILNKFTGWPIGIMILLMNIPLLILGFFYLGRWRFLTRTVISVLVFSLSVEIFIAYLPGWLDNYPLNNDILLNSIYGGIVGGIGGGILYRAGATLGGTGVIGRIVRNKTGAPLSQVYFYTDGVIILTAGLVFGWQIVLYALLTLFLNGVASDYAMEGPSIVRTATIITDKPEAVTRALIHDLDRGVSQWPITGSYTGKSHIMLMCTIQRSQMADLKLIVAVADPHAFLVIGNAHQALGYGFAQLK